MDKNKSMKDQQEYLSEVAKKPMSKVLSWICLAILAVLIIATLVTGISGSPYFLGCLVMLILVPIFMYAVLWFGKLMYLSSRDKNINQQENLTIDTEDNKKDNTDDEEIAEK